jgi:hypothetical protein
MKTAGLPLLLFSFVVVATPAANADVRVEVDPGVPFTERDLAEAVDIRTPGTARPGIVIRVAKLGMDQLVVVVGDRSQIVTLPDRDRAASSRVVALVVTGLLDEGPSPAGATVMRATEPRARARARRTSLLVGAASTLENNGYWMPFVHLGAARALTPSLRVVGTVGYTRFEGYLDTRSTLIPVRLGLEGRAGSAGLELGWQMINYRERACLSAEWGHAEGAYGAAKLFVPVGARTRLVGEAGGHKVIGRMPTSCNSATNYTGHAGWLGASLEWAL